MKKISYLSILLIILALCGASIASAEVWARIRIIEASNQGSSVDPVLRDVHGQLGSLFNFTSYRLLKDVTQGLVGTRPVDLLVHPGRSVEITLVGEYKKLIELRIRIKRDGAPILNTHVRLSPERTILIGGPRHGEGTLIFAISARF